MTDTTEAAPQVVTLPSAQPVDIEALRKAHEDEIAAHAETKAALASAQSSILAANAKAAEFAEKWTASEGRASAAEKELAVDDNEHRRRHAIEVSEHKVTRDALTALQYAHADLTAKHAAEKARADEAQAALEKIGPAGAHRADIAMERLRARRDELLASIPRLSIICSGHRPTDWPAGREFTMGDVIEAEGLRKAALAELDRLPK